MAIVLRTLPGQRRALYVPRDELLRRRDERVRELVSYAARHVPYYRDLDPREIRTADDLELLPLLEKTTVQQDPEQFRADTPLGRDALTFRTAGSTGTPVTIFRDRRSLLENIAYTERERAVETGLAGRRYRYPSATIAVSEGNFPRVREFYGRASFRPLRPREQPIPLDAPPPEQAAALARIKPLVLRGFGSALELLFRSAHAGGWDIHRPAVVVYGGDTMTPAGRALIEEAFGVPVISRYSAAEAFRIGFTCEHRTGFHLHEDLSVVRVVDGELAVTDLLNRGMVLLNYRLGDMGQVGPAGCRCGRTTRLLTTLAGRIESIIRLADGSTVHPRVLEEIVHRRRAVMRFQLVQRADDDFHLRLVTADAVSFEEASPGITVDLRERLGGANVTAERVAELRASDRGKFSSIVGMTSPSGLAGV